MNIQGTNGAGRDENTRARLDTSEVRRDEGVERSPTSAKTVGGRERPIEALGAGLAKRAPSVRKDTSSAGYQGLAVRAAQAEAKERARRDAGPSSPISLKAIDLSPRADVAPMPSPADWRDEALYFAMLDRFERGAGARPLGDPADPSSVHGGNIDGLIRRLDYIKDLGFTAVWISPVVENPEGTYHGYAPRNLLAVDPSKGSMDDLRRLTSEAHARGMRVVLDFVANHTCDAFDYADGDREFAREPSPPKALAGWKEPLYPLELRKAETFSRRGAIRDWNDHEESTTGDFYTYRSLKLDATEPQNQLIRVALWWMRETGVDGLRCDAVKHIDPSFWVRFNRVVRLYAKTLGKENFLLLGEAFDGDARKIGAWMDPHLGDDRSRRLRTDVGFGSMFDIASYLASSAALHGEAPSVRLEDAFHAASRERPNFRSATATWRAKRFYTNFIDSHDVPRFLRPGDDPRALEVALAHAFFSDGMPCLYYGTEQGFTDRTDVIQTLGDRGRTDMFDGAFKAPGKAGDSFDENSAWFRTVQRLATLRAECEPLRRGDQYPRWSEHDRAGIHAFSRIHAGEEIVVVLNPADEARSIPGMWVDAELTPPGTELVDLLHPDRRVVTYAEDGGSKLAIELPAKSVAVLKRPR